MSSQYASNKVREIEAKAVATEQSISAKSSKNAQLEATISSAELYMQALRLADSPTEKERLDAKTKELITKAESLKRLQDGSVSDSRPGYKGDLKYPVSTRKLKTRENIILLEGSKLNGAIFKPWTEKPTLQEFELKDGEEPYTDSLEFSLSESQLKSFDGWRRPEEALRRLKLEKDGVTLPSKPTMVMMSMIDLVQDVTSDCSVVASLCVGTARAEKGHQKILGSIVYPYDYTIDQTVMSPNGRYVLRLYFNGCWRRVEIDDRLPTSKSSRVLHVVDRSHPGLLWPALVEKAYLKVRGGYDFPGSNSGTDLAVITGWIPQQVFLHDEDVEASELWEELLPAFSNGDILLTIGTGKLGRREQQQLGLAAEHDYAVLDLKETAGIREMLIKNPWADGEVWKGAVRRKPNPGHEDEPSADVQETENLEMMPGTFWMDLNSIFQYFENMYINWNCGLFSHRQDLHFTWNMPDTSLVPNIFIDNPQFSIQTSKPGEMWLLLNRHFRTGDYTASNHGKNGYISLYLYDAKGTKVLSSEGAKVRGPFVDSPNTLLRFNIRSNEAYTVVVASQDLPPGKHNFTLSAFSKSSTSLDEAQLKYNTPHSVTSVWSRLSAGGNSDSPRYLENPQYKVQIFGETNIALVLKLVDDPAKRLDQTDIHVKILVALSDGKRVTKLRARDVIAHSGDYRRGSAVVEASLSKGSYSIICSTFEQNQLAKFQLDLYSSSPRQLLLSSVPSESSGRLSIMSYPATFAGEVTKFVAPLTVQRMTKAIFIATQLRASRLSLYKLSVEKGQGAYSVPIACSSSEGKEFSGIAGGVRIEDTDLNSSMSEQSSGGLWLVLERPAQSSSHGSEAEVLQVEILCEERIGIGSWTAVENYT